MKFSTKGATGKDLVYTVIGEKKIGTMVYLLCNQEGHGDSVAMMPKAILKTATVIK